MTTTWEDVLTSLAHVIRKNRELTPPFKLNEEHDLQDHFTEIFQLMDAATRPVRSVVMLGPFNGGKSTLLNAILGIDILPAKLVPTTEIVTRIRSGKSVYSELVTHSLGGSSREDIDIGDIREHLLKRQNADADTTVEIEIELPNDVLPVGWELIDTMGLFESEVNNRNSKATARLGDYVVLVFNATQFGGEPEMRVVSELATYLSGNVLKVLNQIDRLEDDELEDAILRAKQIYGEIGYPPAAIFTVNARAALNIRLNNSNNFLDDYGKFAAHLSALFSDLSTVQAIKICRISRLTMALNDTAERIKETLEKLQEEQETLKSELEAEQNTIRKKTKIDIANIQARLRTVDVEQVSWLQGELYEIARRNMNGNFGEVSQRYESVIFNKVEEVVSVHNIALPNFKVVCEVQLSPVDSDAVLAGGAAATVTAFVASAVFGPFGILVSAAVLGGAAIKTRQDHNNRLNKQRAEDAVKDARQQFIKSAQAYLEAITKQVETELTSRDKKSPREKQIEYSMQAYGDTLGYYRGVKQWAESFMKDLDDIA